MGVDTKYQTLTETGAAAMENILYGALAVAFFAVLIVPWWFIGYAIVMIANGEDPVEKFKSLK
jgi:hypothetical protein